LLFLSFFLTFLSFLSFFLFSSIPDEALDYLKTECRLIN
jgi:hypothetical protein